MNTLLPPNATQLERAVEQVTQRMSDVDVPLRELWDPSRCPEHLLPWLAWAFSVDRWDSDWSIDQKRRAVALALYLHKRKGTPVAVQEAVNLAIGHGEILEPWQFDGRPHTFKIRSSAAFYSNQAYQQFINLVSAAKPVRSWLAAVQLQRETTSHLYLGTFTHTSARIGINIHIDPAPAPATLHVAGVTHYSRTTLLLPAGSTP